MSLKVAKKKLVKSIGRKVGEKFELKSPLNSQLSKNSEESFSYDIF